MGLTFVIFFWCFTVSNSSILLCSWYARLSCMPCSCCHLTFCFYLSFNFSIKSINFYIFKFFCISKNTILVSTKNSIKFSMDKIFSKINFIGIFHLFINKLCKNYLFSNFLNFITFSIQFFLFCFYSLLATIDETLNCIHLI